MELMKELFALTESNDLYSKINDAVMSVGTMKELTSKVSDRVKHLVGAGFNGMNDADIQALMRKADGEEKFALRVAMKVVGRRDPTEA